MSESLAAPTVLLANVLDARTLYQETIDICKAEGPDAARDYINQEMGNALEVSSDVIPDITSTPEPTGPSRPSMFAAIANRLRGPRGAVTVGFAMSALAISACGSTETSTESDPAAQGALTATAANKIAADKDGKDNTTGFEIARFVPTQGACATDAPRNEAIRVMDDTRSLNFLRTHLNYAKTMANTAQELISNNHIYEAAGVPSPAEDPDNAGANLVKVKQHVSNAELAAPLAVQNTFCEKEDGSVKLWHKTTLEPGTPVEGFYIHEFKTLSDGRVEIRLTNGNKTIYNERDVLIGAVKSEDGKKALQFLVVSKRVCRQFLAPQPKESTPQTPGTTTQPKTPAKFLPIPPSKKGHIVTITPTPKTPGKPVKHPKHDPATKPASVAGEPGGSGGTGVLPARPQAGNAAPTVGQTQQPLPERVVPQGGETTSTVPAEATADPGTTGPAAQGNPGTTTPAGQVTPGNTPGGE